MTDLILFNNKGFSHLTASIGVFETELRVAWNDYQNFIVPDADSGDLIYAILRDPVDREIVAIDIFNSVDGLNDKYLKVIRAQGGSSAKAWPSGTLLFLSTHADHYEALFQPDSARQIDFNPNGVLSPNYAGEKILQYTGCEIRWWMSFDAVNPYWQLIAGEPCDGEFFVDPGWGFKVWVPAGCLGGTGEVIEMWEGGVGIPGACFWGAGIHPDTGNPLPGKGDWNAGIPRWENPNLKSSGIHVCETIQYPYEYLLYQRLTSGAYPIDVRAECAGAGNGPPGGDYNRFAAVRVVINDDTSGNKKYGEIIMSWFFLPSSAGQFPIADPVECYLISGEYYEFSWPATVTGITNIRIAVENATDYITEIDWCWV